MRHALGLSILLATVTAHAQDTPEDLSFWSTDAVREAAAKVVPATVSNIAVAPDAEAQRLAEPAAPDLKVDTDIDGGMSTEVIPVGDSHFRLHVKSADWLSAWFVVRVTNVPAGGKTVRFDIDNAVTARMVTANPVTAPIGDWADLTRFAPLPQSDASFGLANNGATFPAAAGQPWTFIGDVWRDTASGMSFVHRFEKDSVVALRVPYSVAYSDAFVKSLDGHPAVTAHRVGGEQGAAVLEIGSTDTAKRAGNPCIVLYTGEEGGQPDGSWAIEGAARMLTADTPEAITLREKCTFLLIPQVDPTAAGEYRFANAATAFKDGISPLASAYIDFFAARAADDKKVTAVIDLFTGDATDRFHVSEYAVSGNAIDVAPFRERFAAALRDGGRFTYRPASDNGVGYDHRLIGMLHDKHAATQLMLNINSQERSRHLSLDEVRKIGAIIATTAGDFFADPATTAGAAK